MLIILSPLLEIIHRELKMCFLCSHHLELQQTAGNIYSTLTNSNTMITVFLCHYLQIRCNFIARFSSWYVFTPMDASPAQKSHANIDSCLTYLFLVIMVSFPQVMKFVQFPSYLGALIHQGTLSLHTHVTRRRPVWLTIRIAVEMWGILFTGYIFVNCITDNCNHYAFHAAW